MYSAISTRSENSKVYCFIAFDMLMISPLFLIIIIKTLVLFPVEICIAQFEQKCKKWFLVLVVHLDSCPFSCRNIHCSVCNKRTPDFLASFNG